MVPGETIKPRRGRKKGTPKTGGRTKGTPNKATVEVREAARQLVEDPEYRENLAKRIRAGIAAPGMEALLWHYAYGKPKELVEVGGPNGAPLPTAVIVEFVDPQ